MKPAILDDRLATGPRAAFGSLRSPRSSDGPPLRVLQLLDTAQFAGTERLVLSLTAALGRAGVDVTLGCRPDGALHAAAVRQGLRVLAVFDGGWFARPATASEPRLPQVRAVVREVRRHSIDIVHGHNGRTTLAAAVAARATGVTAIASQHFVHPASAGYRGAKKLVASAAHGWVNRQLASVVAVSSAARLEMMQRTGLPAERIIHISNGIEPPQPPAAARIEEIRASLKICPGAPLVVTVARLADEKGLEVWVDAVAMVHAIRPDARFVIVGEGPRRPAILARIAEKQLKGVLTLAGFRTDATDWIAAGDVFVLPSPAEPFGLVLLEAMALGKPVVACAAAGPLDIITSGVDGLLAPPSSAAGLAEAVTSLLGNTAFAGGIARAGRTTFHSRFTGDRMAAAVLDVYQAARKPRGFCGKKTGAAEGGSTG